MTSDGAGGRVGREPTSDDDSDAGEPVTELREYRVTAPSFLVARVRNSIQRRNLAAEITSFSIWTPFVVVMELLRSVFEAYRATVDGSPYSSAAEPDPARAP